jgi:hypothetical protein
MKKPCKPLDDLKANKQDTQITHSAGGKSGFYFRKAKGK